ncbi:MAG: helix-turn-helix protein [Herbinix sp.]|jgi:transposase-like protein|nr:helix-turn-helix protein [Herbinix sp.]
MPKYTRYSADIKLLACRDYLSGEYSINDICTKYDIYISEEGNNPIWDWIPAFLENGEDTFLKGKGNANYSKEFKCMVVEEYLKGKDSLRNIAAKYKISSKESIRRWALLYNADRELKDYNPKREVYMAEAMRKTTIKERKEIVKYCIEHNRNYKVTASIYDVSYSQVYSWVKKYDTNGEEGLTDKRGHHKTDDEVDELERLRRENVRLKRQLEEKDMLTELLKKVQEFERM